MAAFSVGQLMQGAQPQAAIPAQVDPLDYSDKFNTPMPPEKLPEFYRWVLDQIKKTGRNPLSDRYDYDVNGYFLSGAGKDSRGHGTDLFKKPNHPTFSDESKYHGVAGNFGGKWINAPGASFYEPSALNMQLHGPQKLRQYFQQVEPDVQLLMPPMSPQQIGAGVMK